MPGSEFLLSRQAERKRKKIEEKRKNGASDFSIISLCPLLFSCFAAE